MKRALIGALVGLAMFSTASLADEKKPDSKAGKQLTEQNQTADEKKAAKREPNYIRGHHHIIRLNPDGPAAKALKKQQRDDRESK